MAYPSSTWRLLDVKQISEPESNTAYQVKIDRGSHAFIVACWTENKPISTELAQEYSCLISSISQVLFVICSEPMLQFFIQKTHDQIHPWNSILATHVWNRKKIIRIRKQRKLKSIREAKNTDIILCFTACHDTHSRPEMCDTKKTQDTRPW